MGFKSNNVKVIVSRFIFFMSSIPLKLNVGFVGGFTEITEDAERICSIGDGVELLYLKLNMFRHVQNAVDQRLPKSRIILLIGMMISLINAV